MPFFRILLLIALLTAFAFEAADLQLVAASRAKALWGSSVGPFASFMELSLRSSTLAPEAMTAVLSRSSLFSRSSSCI